MTEREIIDCIQNINEKNKIRKIDNFSHKIEDKDLHLLIMPSHKWFWTTAAEILQYIGFPRLEIVLPDLLVWLQDMNWPGADKVINILSTCKPKLILPFIENALKTAAAEDDTMWIAGIKKLISNLEIKEDDFSDKDIIHLLTLSDY